MCVEYRFDLIRESYPTENCPDGYPAKGYPAKTITVTVEADSYDDAERSVMEIRDQDFPGYMITDHVGSD